MKYVPFTILILCMIGVSYTAVSQPTKKIPVPVIMQNPEFDRAQNYEDQGKYEEAKKIYKQLYESEGTDNAFWKLLRLYETTRDFDGMETLVLERQKKTPDDISLMRYLARSYYGRGEKKKASRILFSIIGDSWDDIGRIYMAANEFIQQNELDSALEIYRKSREKVGKNELYAHEMGRLYDVRMEYIKAIEEYVKLLDLVNIAYTKIEEMILKAREEGKNPDDIARPIAEFLNDHPGSITAARLLSAHHYENEEYTAAQAVLIPAAVVSESPKFVWELAERFRKDGNMDEALDVYEQYYRYFENDPNRIFALLEMASIKRETGDIQGALGDYKRLAEDYRGTPEGDMAILRTIQLTGDTADFEEYIQSLEDFASSTEFRDVAYEAYLIQGDACLQYGSPERAKKAFDRAYVKARSRAERYDVKVRTALLSLFTGDYKAMSDDIENCVRYNPRGEEINDLLSLKILGMRCSSEQEIQDFKTYSEGYYAFFRKENNVAYESFLRAAEDTSSVVAYYAAVALAELSMHQRDPEKAVTWYLRAAETAGDATLHAGALTHAADVVTLMLDDRKRASALYREALIAAPGNVHESEIRRKLMKVAGE